MNRPKVIFYNGASVDGRIAVNRDSLLLYGDERWKAIEGPDNFDVFQWLRLVHQPQATLEGSGSFVRDGEQPGPLPLFEGDPAPLCQDYLPENILNRPGHRGWFTAVDGRGRIRWYYKEYPDEQWQGWYPVVLVAGRTPPEYLAYLQREEIPYLVAGGSQVDLRQAMEKMKSLLGVECLISTGGGRLNGAMLRLGLIDEVDLVIHPGIIGGTDNPRLFESPELGSSEMPTRLRLISALAQEGGRVWLRYEVISSS